MAGSSFPRDGKRRVVVACSAGNVTRKGGKSERARVSIRGYWCSGSAR